MGLNKPFLSLFLIFLLVACQKKESTPAIVLHELNESALPVGNKTFALTGAKLIDGNGGEPVENAVVLIKGNQFIKVGRAGTFDIPAEAEIINLKGMTLLPGLIDAHYHNEETLDLAPLFLQNGITSVRDPGAWIEAYDSLRGSGRIIPRLFLTGPHLNTWPPAYPKDCILVKDEAECALAVEKAIQKGSTGIKVYFGLSIGMIRKTCEVAHQHGLPVTGHLETANARDAIEAGLDGIEHITSFGTSLLPLRMAEQYKQKIMADNEARRRGRYEVWNSLNFDHNLVADSLAQFLVQKHTYVSSTLAVFEKQKDQGDSVEVIGFRKMLSFAGLLKRKGVHMVVGSHSEVPYAKRGFAYFREMELLHTAGLSNMEVIEAATMENARFFRISERLGSVEEGKLADLIVVNGDPLKDLQAMRQVRMVMLNGSWVRR